MGPKRNSDKSDDLRDNDVYHYVNAHYGNNRHAVTVNKFRNPSNLKGILARSGQNQGNAQNGSGEKATGIQKPGQKGGTQSKANNGAKPGRKIGEKKLETGKKSKASQEKNQGEKGKKGSKTKNVKLKR